MSETRTTLQEYSKPSQEGKERARLLKDQNYVDISQDLALWLPERRDKEAFKEAFKKDTLPEPNSSLTEAQRDVFEAIVDLLADEAYGPADMSKYHNVFEDQYKNEDDLLDDYREKLAAIHQSDSDGRKFAYMALNEAASARWESESFSKVESDLIEWANFKYAGDMPRKYYNVDGSERKRRGPGEVEDSFKMECEKKEHPDTKPDLPNFKEYYQIWHDSREFIVTLVLNPDMSLDDTHEAVQGLEQNNKVLHQYTTTDKASVDLRIPFRQMLYLVVRGVEATLLKGQAKTKVEADLTSERSNFAEQVRRARQPRWWPQFIHNSVKIVATKAPSAETRSQIVAKWEDYRTKKGQDVPQSHFQGSTLGGGIASNLDTRMSGMSESETDPDEELEALKARHDNFVKNRGIKPSVMYADGRTQYGRVIGVQRIGRGSFRIALNAGTEEYPLLTVMNPSSLGGMVSSWENDIPWPTCDAKARGRENLENIIAILEVPESSGKKEEDEKKKARGQSVRKPITYFLVQWKNGEGEYDTTLTSRSALITAKLASHKKLDETDIPLLREQRSEAEEIIQSMVRLGRWPNTLREVTEEEKASMPWLFPTS